jgi:nucleotide-binding universal stress UspA family protein
VTFGPGAPGGAGARWNRGRRRRGAGCPGATASIEEVGVVGDGRLATTVVVPLDGSALAERALPVARWLACRSGAGLHLVTTDWHGGTAEPSRYLACVAAGIGDAVVKTSVHPRRTAPEAIALARGEDPGALVCMTTHGRGGLRWAMLGSVAEEVVHQLGEPVLLVGRHCDPTWPTARAGDLLVCVGGPAADTDVDAVRRWSTALGMRVRLVFVAHPLDVETAQLPDECFAPLRERFAEVGIDAPGELLRSSYVAGAIADAAADLPAFAVVAARRPHGKVGRTLLGDNLPAIVAASPCPVLVTEVPA